MNNQANNKQTADEQAGDNNAGDNNAGDNQAEAAFAWTDAYLLGYGPMDDTHREFVQIVSAMLQADDASFTSHFKAFALHAERHFGEEKQWMESSEFPARECHIDEHTAVMKSVREVEVVLDQGDIDAGRSLARALADWFPGHADYMDAALSHWMAKRSYGGKPLVFRRDAVKA